MGGCMPLHKTKKTHSNKANIVSLYNKGMICTKYSNHQVSIKYYPLSTNCISSSKVDWKLLGVDTKLKGNSLYIDTYGLYKQNYPNMATADCAGAGVKKKLVAIPSNINSIYWGNSKIADLNKNKSICVQKSSRGLKRVRAFR
jgi:hypothetical protein